MNNFIKKQIIKVLNGIQSCQTTEQSDSHIFYRQLSFDVAFAKAQSILLIVTDLIEFLDKSEEKEKYSNLGYTWNKCKQASDLIKTIERNGKEDGCIHYYQHKVDHELEKLYTFLNFAIEKTEPKKNNNT